MCLNVRVTDNWLLKTIYFVIVCSIFKCCNIMSFLCWSIYLLRTSKHNLVVGPVVVQSYVVVK